MHCGSIEKNPYSIRLAGCETASAQVAGAKLASIILINVFSFHALHKSPAAISCVRTFSVPSLANFTTFTGQHVQYNLVGKLKLACKV